MVATSLTTKLAQERLAALKRFIPLRDRVRDKLQQQQESQIDFSESSQQLFAPITTATKGVTAATERAIYGDIPEEERKKKTPLLDTLEKIAAETGQTKQSLETLPVDIATARSQQRRKEQMLEQIRQRQFEEEPELEQEQPEQIYTAKRDEQDIVEKWSTPENTLTQDAIATIREINNDDELIDFAASKFEKKKREKYIIDGRSYRINDINDWSRMVFLTNRGIDTLPRGDNEYQDFKSKVKNKRDELKIQKKSETPKRPPGRPQAKKYPFPPRRVQLVVDIQMETLRV